MVSYARASQRVSLRSVYSSAVAKNLDPLAAGRPSCLSNPAPTSTGMSCSLKPSSHAVSLMPSRAGSMACPHS